MSISNPKAAEYSGVSVEHPQIKEAIKNCAKRGVDKDQAAKLVGMPREVVDRYYREEGK